MSGSDVTSVLVAWAVSEGFAAVTTASTDLFPTTDGTDGIDGSQVLFVLAGTHAFQNAAAGILEGGVVYTLHAGVGRAVTSDDDAAFVGVTIRVEATSTTPVAVVASIDVTAADLQPGDFNAFSATFTAPESGLCVCVCECQ